MYLGTRLGVLEFMHKMYCTGNTLLSLKSLFIQLNFYTKLTQFDKLLSSKNLNQFIV